MAANQMLHQIAHTTPSEEWVDFDNSFDLPYSGGLGSNRTTSIDSVSPKDLELGFAEFDDCNWGPNPGVCTQDFFSDLINYDPSCEEYALGGAQSLLDPSGVFQQLPGSPDQGLIASGLSDEWSQDVGGVNDPFYASVRQMVEVQAAADSGCLSSKEKRMEASIAIHLQRLQNAAMQELAMSPNSSTTYPSPRWSDSAQMSVSQSGTWTTPANTPPSETVGNPSASTEPTGGMEMVLDLNMNMTTNGPKKQKPRSRAQKENYIKIRKAGACEKHRKQHKRCNCLEKMASRLSVHADAVSTIPLDVRSTANAQMHVHSPGKGSPGKGSLYLKSVSAPTRRSPDLSTTGGLVSREDQYAQLQQVNRLPSTSTSSLGPQYGHHSQRAVQDSARSPNTGQSDVLCKTHRSPVSCRTVDLVHSTPGRLQSSSSSIESDQKSHTSRHSQTPVRLRTVPSVSTHWRASFEASVSFDSRSLGDQRSSTEDTKTRTSRPEGRPQHGSSRQGSLVAHGTAPSVSSSVTRVSSALQSGENAVASAVRRVPSSRTSVSSVVQWGTNAVSSVLHSASSSSTAVSRRDTSSSSQTSVSSALQWSTNALLSVLYSVSSTRTIVLRGPSPSEALQWSRSAVSSVLPSVSSLSCFSRSSIFGGSAFGSYFGKVVIFSSRQVLLARKGLGMC
ncbi:hypothetical protein BO71DRAFT_404522 [Aspergillus ellipticus CBS 707.79]|uniref:Uncharacterized protein n=1 Tax=Aspergillus ellipticus CBS 707.79 TaxID=1448320 RepID=A0A319DHL8_9EURO|nr:hypothetical protein BO71DRAFT_404522 [Aspergillus ellipticus CBS 707.79]